MSDRDRKQDRAGLLDLVERSASNALPALLRILPGRKNRPRRYRNPVRENELPATLEAITVRSVESGRLPPEFVRPGIRVLDLWTEGSSGAMLFWIGIGTDGPDEDQPALQHVIAKKIHGSWKAIGHAISTVEPWDDFQAARAPGLVRFGGGSASQRDREDRVTWHSARVIWATAGPEVAAIRLTDATGGKHERPPGRHGFVLLGITNDDPITYASGLDASGHEISGEPILL